MKPVRVAFFTDSYDESNGVARLSRALSDYAARRDLPFLCVHGGSATRVVVEGRRTHLELRRGAARFRLDHDLSFDLLFWRHASRVARALKEWRPDVLHFTAPGDVGQLAAYLGYRLGIPMIGSWHTNVHQYAALRVMRRSSWLPPSARAAAGDWLERRVLAAAALFYRIPRVVIAPNEELVRLLAERTRTRTLLMKHGVDTTLFSPSKRTRPDDGLVQIGFVGRLSPEKQVRRLVAVEQALRVAGRNDVRFIVIGDGAERRWLEQQMPSATFCGVLGGEELARAYANLDLFVFPSESETFGLVVLEAMASGVPVVAMARGGPTFVLRHGESGWLAADEPALIDLSLAATRDGARRKAAGRAARERALTESWDNVFDDLYDVYAREVLGENAVEPSQAARVCASPAPGSIRWGGSK